MARGRVDTPDPACCAARKVSPGMAICNRNDFADALPTYGRLMGLDLGTKTIGIAVSDVMRSIATPSETLKRTKFTQDAAFLLKEIDKLEIAGIVLGWPLEMDGTEGKRCQSTHQFALNLLRLRDIPVLLQDERLSTTAVERTLIGEADLTRKTRAAVVDRAAAAFILQGALDALGHLG